MRSRTACASLPSLSRRICRTRRRRSSAPSDSPRTSAGPRSLRAARPPPRGATRRPPASRARGGRPGAPALPARRSASRRGVIDTHAHLHACADPPLELVERARAAGVDRILEVGASPARWDEVVEFCAELEGLEPILGIHPHDAGDADASDLARLADLPAVAVGETGLDYYRDYAPRDAQRQ